MLNIIFICLRVIASSVVIGLTTVIVATITYFTACFLMGLIKNINKQGRGK